MSEKNIQNIQDVKKVSKKTTAKKTEITTKKAAATKTTKTTKTTATKKVSKKNESESSAEDFATPVTATNAAPAEPIKRPQTWLDVKSFASYVFELAINQQQIFLGHGFVDADEEAYHLILPCIPQDVAESLEKPEEIWQHHVPDDIWQNVKERLEARIERQVPTAYLNRIAYFQGLQLYIDERALIPRSFLGEVLTSGNLNYFVEQMPRQPRYILELCTGGGSVAILAADIFNEAHVDALDISADALEVAHINHRSLMGVFPDWGSRIYFFESDLYNNSTNPAGGYDLIISNPPYVCDASMKTLPNEYLYEPNIALAGGTDGMDLVRRIITGAKKYIAPHGVLVVEIGNEYEHARQMFKELGIKQVMWLTTSAGEKQVFAIEAKYLQDC